MIDNSMKLPKRNYLDVISAQWEPMWDKIKNNTFVNMFFPVKEVSEGNTVASLVAAVPGVLPIKTAVKTVGEPLYVYNAKQLGLKIGRGRPVNNINEMTGQPITMDDILTALSENGRIRYEGVLSEQEIRSLAARQLAEKKAGYNAIIQKQIRKEDALAKQHPDVYSRKRANYAPRKKAEILGDSQKPLLTNTINVEKEFKYDRYASVEDNWNKFINQMLHNYHFTLKDAEEVFNEKFGQYFLKQGGKINYLNIFINEQIR